MKTFSKIVLTAPLALALAACGAEDDAATVSNEPIAAIPAPDGSDWNQQVVRTEAGGWLVGNPDAPVKLLEYGSLTCPACAAFSMDAKGPLHEKYIASGVVNFELRSVPLHGVVDLLLTRILDCAPKEVAVPLADQVWANLNAVIDPVQANEAGLQAAFNLPEDQRFAAMAQAGQLDQFFAARGLSTDMTQQCLSDFEAVQSLAETISGAAEGDNVSGTPTFFLNGQPLSGTSWSIVESALQQAGAR